MTDRIVAFDIEMPGQKELRISAIGITVIENAEVTERFYHLVNPETEFDPYVVKLIGITPEMVANEPAFPAIWQEIEDVMSSGLLVAHGATGDMKTLCTCLKHYGIKWQEKVRYACTCDMGLACYPHLAGHSLDVMCEHIGFHELDHHNALSDSEGCARLVLDYEKNGLSIEEFITEFDTVNVCKVKPKKKKRKKKNFEEKIRNVLFASQSEKVRNAFLKKNPGYGEERVIGVDERKLRAVASKLIRTNQASEYIKKLPHEFHEEDNIHAMIISRKNKYSSCISLIQKFLPYVDNLETCNLINPKIFKSQQPELIDEICKWLSSKQTYTEIFALNVIINSFTDKEYLLQWLELVSGMRTDDALVNSKRAQFFANALLFDEMSTKPFFESGQIDKWTHNMAIQKSAYSKGISDEKRKEFIKLRR